MKVQREMELNIQISTGLQVHESLHGRVQEDPHIFAFTYEHFTDESHIE